MATRVSTPVLLSRFLDDAAIFPPGNAPMSEAVEQHGSYQSAWYAGIVGNFVCTDARVAELAASLPEDLQAPLELTLVVPGGVAAVEPAVRAVADEHRLALRALDVPASADDLAATVATLDALSLDVPTYVEPPLHCSLEPLQASRHRVKFRTGGVTPGSVPSRDLLASALTEAASLGLPFKLTAGLHHAVAAPGRHGFLNVALAVHASLDGRRVEDVASVLALPDAEVVTGLAQGLTLEDARAVRQLFVSFGTCSISEPLADLVALGLLTPVGS